jgi:hypothetical protein
MIDTTEREVWDFLEHWTSIRTAQIQKYQRRANRYKQQKYPGWEFLYEGARRSQRHYEQELACLEALEQAFNKP